ncbi:hypothetical protein GGI42DRAFT_16221 [Trichoderma sp. SZMC 28013]
MHAYVRLCCPFFPSLWSAVWSGLGFSCFTGSIQLCVLFDFSILTDRHALALFFFHPSPAPYSSAVQGCKGKIHVQMHPEKFGQEGVWLVNAKLDAVCHSQKPRTSISIGQQSWQPIQFFFPSSPFFFFSSFG